MKIVTNSIYFLADMCIFQNVLIILYYKYTKLNWHPWICRINSYNSVKLILDLQTLWKVKYFLILYPSLSRLAIWIERIAVKVEIVGSSLTTYNIFLKKYLYFLS